MLSFNEQTGELDTKKDKPQGGQIWLKFSVGMLDDYKLAIIRDELGDSGELLFYKLILLAGKQYNHGSLMIGKDVCHSYRSIAIATRIHSEDLKESTAFVEKALRRFEQLQMVAIHSEESQRIELSNFDKYQNSETLEKLTNGTKTSGAVRTAISRLRKETSSSIYPDPSDDRVEYVCNAMRKVMLIPTDMLASKMQDNARLLLRLYDALSIEKAMSILSNDAKRNADLLTSEIHAHLRKQSKP